MTGGVQNKGNKKTRKGEGPVTGRFLKQKGIK